MNICINHHRKKNFVPKKYQSFLIRGSDRRINSVLDKTDFQGRDRYRTTSVWRHENDFSETYHQLWYYKRIVFYYVRFQI